jgi:ATP-dependent DNA helicase DinG
MIAETNIDERTRRREEDEELPELDAIFLPGGKMSAQLPGYEYRADQLRFARAVARGLLTDRAVCAEAGTGCGKSLGTMIPLAVYKEEGEKIIVSTMSLALQDQYMKKDLPFVAKLLGDDYPLTYAVAKGKSNFVCRDKVNELLGELGLSAEIGQEEWKAFTEWLATTETGDRGEIAFPISDALWGAVACEDICKKNGCPFYKAHSCFFQKAKARYDDADILVTNHYLYMLDRYMGGHILGDHRAVVFDEAHELAECAQGVLGKEITSRTISGFLHYAHRTLTRLGIWPERLDFKREIDEVTSMEAALWRNFVPLIGKDDPSVQITLDAVPQHLMDGARAEADRLIGKLEELYRGIGGANATPKYSREMHGEALDGVKAKFVEHIDTLNTVLRLEHYGPLEPEKYLNWCIYLDGSARMVGKGAKHYSFTINMRPVDIAPLMRELIFGYPDAPSKPVRSACLISATLAIAGDFSYAKSQLGVVNPIELIVGSPFDYKKQCTLYLPTHIPDPQKAGEAAYLSVLTDEIEQILRLTRGRAFVLFTSKRHMEHVYREISRRGLPYTLLKQGDMGKQALIAAKKEDIHSVLFGVKTYWTGVDVPGEALTGLIIVKMPFRVPMEPMYAATARMIEARGGQGFRDLGLPDAINKLRQGFGRLIRTTTDRGFVALLDSRMLTKGYAPKVIGSLPDMKVIKELPAKLDL